jgi:hypothetical protein
VPAGAGFKVGLEEGSLGAGAGEVGCAAGERFGEGNPEGEAGEDGEGEGDGDGDGVGETSEGEGMRQVDGAKPALGPLPFSPAMSKMTSCPIMTLAPMTPPLSPLSYMARQ